MDLYSTGKKFFGINKNLESEKIFINTRILPSLRNNSDKPVLKSYEPDDHIKNLHRMLEEKEIRILELKKLLDFPYEHKKPPPLLNNQNLFTVPEDISQAYKDYHKDLQAQILENKIKKIQAAKEKENETKKRIEQLKVLHDLEIKERLERINRANEYRNHLEMQNQLREQINEKGVDEENLLRRHGKTNLRYIKSHNYLPSPRQKIRITSNLHRFPSIYQKKSTNLANSLG